jgi:hypothetical protein
MIPSIVLAVLCGTVYTSQPFLSGFLLGIAFCLLPVGDDDDRDGGDTKPQPV